MSHTSDLTNRRGRRRARLGRPLIASAVALSVAIAGCGDDEPTSQASTPAPGAASTPGGSTPQIPKNAKKPGKRTLAWAEDVCKAWGQGVGEITAPTATSKAAVRAYFEDVAELYADKEAALEKIGPPPVGGDEGKATWARLVGTLGVLQNGIASIAENPPTDQQSLNRQIAVVQRTRGPVASLRTDPALVVAFDQPGCEDISR